MKDLNKVNNQNSARFQLESFQRATAQPKSVPQEKEQHEHMLVQKEHNIGTTDHHSE